MLMATSFTVLVFILPSSCPEMNQNWKHFLLVFHLYMHLVLPSILFPRPTDMTFSLLLTSIMLFGTCCS